MNNLAVKLCHLWRHVEALTLSLRRMLPVHVSPCMYAPTYGQERQLQWCLQAFEDGGCFDDYLPHNPPPDLVILENMAGKSAPPSVERLLWRLGKRAEALGRQRPAVLWINTPWVLGDNKQQLHNQW